jgi:hypothetical protein
MNVIQFDPRNPNIGQRIRAWWFNGQTNSELDLMGSPGQWDLAVGEPRGVMAARSPADRTAPSYMMSSPGTWSLSDGGPQDMMAGRQR